MQLQTLRRGRGLSLSSQPGIPALIVGWLKDTDTTTIPLKLEGKVDGFKGFQPIS
jgi:hypothetical protein